MAVNQYEMEFSKQALKIIDEQGPDFKAKVFHQLNLFTEYRQNHGLSFEKLHGQDGLCCIRLNRECRLILTKTQNRLRLERILLHHEYVRLKSLSVGGGFDHSAMTSGELTFIGEAFSQCSEIQQDVLDKPKYQNIEMILGLPGTGKSILLCRAIAERINPDERVLYLCPSHLVDSTQRLFNLQGVGSNVIVTDYANYMGLDESFEETKDLLKWLERARKTHDKKIIPYLTDALAQEFELISATGSDEYFELSTTQSCYTVQLRTFLLELFQNYMGEGNSRKNVRLSKMLPVTQIENRVSMIAIDEVQTFSRTQLRNLFKSFESFENASQIQLFVAGDENQNLSTASSPLPFLRKLIQDYGMSFGETRLKQGFRSPPRVEILANQLLSLRRRCFGEPHRSAESNYDHQALAFEHCISHVTKIDLIPQPPDDLYERLQYIVITDSFLLDEARAHFPSGTLVTSYDKAHGIQFKNVILWRPFDNSTFAEINQTLKNPVQPIERGIRAEEVSHHTRVQQVYTAILRTMQQLIIFDPKPLRHLCKALELSSGITLSIDVGAPVSEQVIQARIEQLIECGVLDDQTLAEISDETIRPCDTPELRSSSTTPMMSIIAPKLESALLPLEPSEQNMLEKFCQKVKDNPDVLSSVLKSCIKKQNAENCLDFLFHSTQTNLFQFLMDNKPYIQKLIQILINDISLFLNEFHSKINFSSVEWEAFQAFRALCVTEKLVKDTPLVHQLMKSRSWEKLVPAYFELGGDINAQSAKEKNTLMHDEAILCEHFKVSLILKLGGDINACNFDGMTPFHVVLTLKISSQKRIKLVKDFLMYGRPYLDATLEIGSSVLGYAITHNQLDIVKLLVEADEQCITFLDRYNLSFLAHAIFENCQIDVIAYLLKSGLEPNGFNHNDITNFSSAITLDRLDIVELLLRQPTIDPNFGGRFVPLTVAMRNRKIQKVPIIKKLLTHPDIDVNRVTLGLCSYTPLGFLVHDNEQIELVRLLLNHGADPNIAGGAKKTFPLHDAIMNYNLDMVKLLLECRANPNSLDDEGNNALHLAVKTRHLKIIQHILNSEVDVNHINSSDEAPLFQAIKEEQSDIVKMICKTGKVHFDILFGPDKYSYLSLIICEYPNFEILKLFLQYGANPNLIHEENVTPLYLAAQDFHEKLVELLLEKGADPNISTQDNISPLMIASQFPNASKLIRTLLAHKADVNSTRLSNSTTPLMLAIQHSAYDVIATLLQSKANPYAMSKQESCAISLAISKKQVGILELLIKYGVDINHPIHDGLTPLMYAVQLEYSPIVAKILEYEGIAVNALSPKGCSALTFACKTGDASLVKLLSDKGVDSNLVVGKNNPLCVVASLGNIEIANYLIPRGALVNPPWEPSPLVMAMDNKQDKMVTFLLEKGTAASVSLTGPHSIWIPAIQSGHIPNLIQIQKSLGGSFDQVIVDNKTPLTLAIDFRCKEIFHWLVSKGVTPSPEQIKLMCMWDDLIFVDGIIQEAKKLYEKLLVVPNKKDLDKEIDFKEILDRLTMLHSKYIRHSELHGLSYFADLMGQLKFFIGKIQEFVTSQLGLDVTSQLRP